eukprot:2256268-Pleurochrysis_carterae.AAC.2
MTVNWWKGRGRQEPGSERERCKTGRAGCKHKGGSEGEREGEMETDSDCRTWFQRDSRSVNSFLAHALCRREAMTAFPHTSRPSTTIPSIMEIRKCHVCKMNLTAYKSRLRNSPTHQPQRRRGTAQWASPARKKQHMLRIFVGSGGGGTATGVIAPIRGSADGCNHRKLMVLLALAAINLSTAVMSNSRAFKWLHTCGERSYRHAFEPGDGDGLVCAGSIRRCGIVKNGCLTDNGLVGKEYR